DSPPGAPIRRVEGMTGRDDRGNEAVRGVTFEIRSGEVLGIAGVAGNGQDELVQALIGLRRTTGGRVHLGSSDVTGHSPRAMNEAGVAYVPADRHRFGLVLPFTVADNLALTRYHTPPLARGVLRDDRAIETAAEGAIGEFDIRPPSPLPR